MLDFYAREGHFKDHIAPIKAYIESLGFPTRWIGRGEKSDDQSRFAVVSSFGDLKRASAEKKMVFFCEHGAGQSYNVRNASYAGGPSRENVCMFLNPGPHVTAQNKRFYPHIPNVEMGVPKLDERHLALTKEPHEPKDIIPTVCFSFHWDCIVCEETRSGFNHFKDAVLKTSKREDLRVIGHCHPRARKEIVPFYEQHGIPFVKDFEDVMDQADVYVCDNSSTIFEFASIGKPVVLLNPPFYRRFLEHGLRFWDAAGIGPNASNTAEVASTINEVLVDTIEAKANREAIVNRVYFARDGEAAKRGAEAILEYMEETERVIAEGNYIRCKRTIYDRFGFVDAKQTIFIFPTYAVVNDVMGKFFRRVHLGKPMDPIDRIRELIKSSPMNYELVEPDLAKMCAMADEEEEMKSFSSKADGFTPADKTLTAEDLFIVKGIQEGLSKTKIVYKSRQTSGFSTAALQRAWDRLESDGIIVPGEGSFSWEVRKWGL